MTFTRPINAVAFVVAAGVASASWGSCSLVLVPESDGC